MEHLDACLVKAEQNAVSLSGWPHQHTVHHISSFILSLHLFYSRQYHDNTSFSSFKALKYPSLLSCPVKKFLAKNLITGFIHRALVYFSIQHCKDNSVLPTLVYFSSVQKLSHNLHHMKISDKVTNKNIKQA